MLQTRIFAHPITNLTDARYFAAWEVDWLGFNLEIGTETYTLPAKMKEIRNWIEGPQIFASFGLTAAETILETAAFLQLDAVHVGHFTPLPTVQTLAKHTPVFKECVLSAGDDLPTWQAHCETFAPFVEAFFFDFSKNHLTWQRLQNDESLTISELQALCQRFPIIFSLDCNADQLHSILKTLQPDGWSLAGGAEEKVGVKSFDQLEELFEVLQID